MSTPSPDKPLSVVAVTYSPGTHLDRFLSSLTVATDRPLTVVLADNGSTDGAPEEAVTRYPGTRLLRISPSNANSVTRRGDPILESECGKRSSAARSAGR